MADALGRWLEQVLGDWLGLVVYNAAIRHRSRSPRPRVRARAVGAGGRRRNSREPQGARICPKRGYHAQVQLQGPAWCRSSISTA